MIGYVACLEFQSTGVQGIVAAAAERDLVTVVLTAEPENPRLQRQIDDLPMELRTWIRVQRCIYNDITSIMAVVKRLQEDAPVFGLFSPEDDSVEVASEIAATLGLPTSPTKSYNFCRNKERLRGACQAIGLSSLRYGAVTDIRSLKDVAEVIGYPLISKPSRGSGSESINAIWNKEQLVEVAPSLLAGCARYGGTLLLEQYLLGPLFSAECVTFNGCTSIIGITDRRLSNVPDFNEVNETYPFDLSPEIGSQVAALVAGVHQVAGFSHGPSHLEFILTKDGPELVELNPRLGGALIGHAMSYVHRCNMFDLYISSAIGTVPQVIPESRGFVSQTALFAPRAGRIAAVRNLNLLPSLRGFVRYESVRKIGDEVGTVRDASGWIGHVLCHGETCCLATRYADAAENLVVVEME